MSRARHIAREACGGEQGSGLLLAVIALTLLTSIGVALLFVTETDMRLASVDNFAKRAFYGAEAALEDGREQLRQWNIASGTLSLDDELALAAGGNNTIDFDPAAVAPVFNAGGMLTSFTGTGDDVPLRGIQAFEGGWIASFVTNDPAEGRLNLNDTNKRLTVTGLSVTSGGSFEMAEAVVNHDGLVPSPPATITIVGPEPEFTGGSSAAKALVGDDCVGSGVPGIPSLSVPVVGVIGSSAVDDAEDGVNKPLTYVSGGNTGEDTVGDITAVIDPRWSDCEYMRQLAARVRDIADVNGNSSTSSALFGTPGNEKIVFIDGDYAVSGTLIGAGVLWVTGQLTINGNLSWYGPIFVVGEGHFRQNGGGTANISGGTLVADIAGPDETLWTADDCSGPDGISGNGDDGPAEGEYDVNGAGAGDKIYCTEHLKQFPLRWPFEIVEFRQY